MAAAPEQLPKTTGQIDVEWAIENLTLKEKVTLLAGHNTWGTFPVERLNIPRILVSFAPQNFSALF